MYPKVWRVSSKCALFRSPSYFLPLTHQHSTKTTHKPTTNMANAMALFSTSSLKAQNAPPYSIMEGKLDASLLRSLENMGMSYMTPVQQKILEMPSLRNDWYVSNPWT